MLGNAFNVLGLTHLPLERIILVGNFVQNLHFSLMEKQNPDDYYDIMVQNFCLDNHMQQLYKETPLSILVCDKELGLFGALKYFRKHHHDIIKFN